MSTLGIIWFWLAPLLLTIYCILDGFDLGVGALYGFLKKPEDKKNALYSIWPVWNGNEVWLIGSFGVLLAAFPPVYGALLTAMYIPVYLVLLSIILRGVSIEYLLKVKSPQLKKILEGAFVFGSGFIIFATGFVGGNVLSGVAIDSNGVMQESFLSLFNPFALSAGIASLLFFTGHAVTYLLLKTEGNFKESLKRIYPTFWLISILFMIIALVIGKFMVINSFTKPVTLIMVVLAISAYGCALLLNRRSSFRLSFTFSALAIGLLVFSCAQSAFPVILRSSLSNEFNMTIANCAGTEKSLLSSLIIVLTGLPFIATFMIWIYRVFQKSPVEHY
jgi:cytochrome d ubiquinol oxidase subunit II